MLIYYLRIAVEIRRFYILQYGFTNYTIGIDKTYCDKPLSIKQYLLNATFFVKENVAFLYSTIFGIYRLPFLLDKLPTAWQPYIAKYP